MSEAVFAPPVPRDPWTVGRAWKTGVGLLGLALGLEFLGGMLALTDRLLETGLVWKLFGDKAPAFWKTFSACVLVVRFAGVTTAAAGSGAGPVAVRVLAWISSSLLALWLLVVAMLVTGYEEDGARPGNDLLHLLFAVLVKELMQPLFSVAEGLLGVTLALWARSRRSRMAEVLAWVFVGLSFVVNLGPLAASQADGPEKLITWLGWLRPVRTVPGMLAAIMLLVSAFDLGLPQALPLAATSTPGPSGRKLYLRTNAPAIDAGVRTTLDLRLARGEIGPAEYEAIQNLLARPVVPPFSPPSRIPAVPVGIQARPWISGGMVWGFTLGGAGAAILFALDALLVEASAGRTWTSTEKALFELFVLLAVAGWVLSVIGWSILIYRAWKALAPYQPATTPGRAVGLLFVPLFNLYWQFVALRGLAIDFNRALASSGKTGVPPINEGVPTAICILNLLSMVPLLNLLVILPGLILMLVFMGSVLRSVNAFMATEGPGEPGWG